MFFNLKDKVSEPIWRILFNYYKHSKNIVKYYNNLSDPITCTEGVKQGGILSSYLFNYFKNELLEKCTDLNIGASINGLNLSIIAYCDDIVIISPSFGQAVKLLEKCFDYSKEWKIDFNPKKSVCLSLSSSGKILNTNIIIRGTNIPNVQGFEYLGLPLGTHNYIREFIEEKWKKVEKSMYSLYGLGCKPSVMNPNLVGFLYKQYCQSIFRHVLDNISIPNSILKEFDTRQNILIKRMIGLKKFTHISALNEAVKIESISQIYSKHKIFFLEQLLRCPSCKDTLFYIRENQTYFNKKNTSFCVQLKCLESRLFINCFDYQPKIIKALIEFSYKSHNRGLVDSVKFVIINLTQNLERRSDVIYWYKILNELLKVFF